jgi:hypothetical protein
MLLIFLLLLVAVLRVVHNKVVMKVRVLVVVQVV